MAKKNEGSSLEKENQFLLTLAKQQAARIRQLEAEKEQLHFDYLLLKGEIEILRKVAGA